MIDKSFHPEKQDIDNAMELLLSTEPSSAPPSELVQQLPENGIGEQATLDLLAPLVLGGAARLGSDTAFAHMDPPTPWITWMMHGWNASLNQNLLHPDVSPIATDIEQRVMDWLCPYFGMSGGHLTPGSTVSNLTALWAARDLVKVKRVVASTAAHVSIEKAANILGLELISLPCNSSGQLDETALPKDLSDVALVLTVGTTSAGAIDSLALTDRAAWTHVDAAWAGPLRFSNKHAAVLAGIERADSIAVSAHKWLYQPKECGVLMFRDVESANNVLSVSGAYLKKPNVGLLGSHGATAVPLLATLIAWGRSGLAQRIDSAMGHAESLVTFLKSQNAVELFSDNVTGVVLWRLINHDSAIVLASLPDGAASTTQIDGQLWVRHVSANPNVDIDQLQKRIAVVIEGISKG